MNPHLPEGWILPLALFVLPLQAVGWSFVGAVVLNMVIAVNHRRDHYIAG